MVCLYPMKDYFIPVLGPPAGDFLLGPGGLYTVCFS